MKSLNTNKPLETKSGHPVKIYEIFYNRYLLGAYYDRDTDIWYPRQWDWDGSDSLGEFTLGLYNVK
jgi:hypothetical protein